MFAAAFSSYAQGPAVSAEWKTFFTVRSGPLYAAALIGMFYRFVAESGRQQCLVLFLFLRDVEARFGPVWESLPSALPHSKILLIDLGAAELDQFYSLQRTDMFSLYELWQQLDFWHSRFYFAYLRAELRAGNLQYSGPGWQLSGPDTGFIHLATPVLRDRFCRSDSLTSWEFWTHPLCNLYYANPYRAGPALPTENLAFDLYGLARIGSLALEQWLAGNDSQLPLVQEIQQNLARYYNPQLLERGIAYTEKLHGQTRIPATLSAQDLRGIFAPEPFSLRQRWLQFNSLPWPTKVRKCLKYALPYGSVRAMQNLRRH